MCSRSKCTIDMKIDADRHRFRKNQYLSASVQMNWYLSASIVTSIWDFINFINQNCFWTKSWIDVKIDADRYRLIWTDADRYRFLENQYLSASILVSVPKIFANWYSCLSYQNYESMWKLMLIDIDLSKSPVKPLPISPSQSRNLILVNGQYWTKLVTSMLISYRFSYRF